MSDKNMSRRPKRKRDVASVLESPSLEPLALAFNGRSGNNAVSGDSKPPLLPNDNESEIEIESEDDCGFRNHQDILRGCFTSHETDDCRYHDYPWGEPRLGKDRGYRDRDRYSTDGWFRGSFPSAMPLHVVEGILQKWIDGKVFDSTDNHCTIEHLAFCTEEAVHELETDAAPVFFPVKLLGEILKRCHRSGNRGRNHHRRGSGSCNGHRCLKTLNLDHIMLVGRTAAEFECAFRQLSRCSSILEVKFGDCEFLVIGDDDQEPLDYATRRIYAETVYYPVMFKRLVVALNVMKSLDVIIIDYNNRVVTIDDAFVDVLQRKDNKQKPIKALELHSCLLSDHLVAAMFGTNSRVERLSLCDCVRNHNLPVLAKRLRTENRTLKVLHLRSFRGPGITGIPETLEILEALGVNKVLKHLHLDMDCGFSAGASLANGGGGGSSNFNKATVRSFIEAIENLAALEILGLNFHLGYHLRTASVYEESLRHISSILGNGLGRNETIKAFDVRVDGMDKPEDQDVHEQFRTRVSNVLNNSLIHALSSQSMKSSLSLSPPSKQKTTTKRKEPWWYCSETTTKSVLQEYRFYVDGNFPVLPDPTTEFWMSLNQTSIRKLRQKPDDLALWGDAIVQHSRDPSIIYHVLRQNNMLLMNVVPRPEIDSESKSEAMWI